MKLKSVSASFIRPADTTAYAAGDLVANSTTAGSVAPMSFKFSDDSKGLSALVKRARLTKTGTGANPTFRVHLYHKRPTVTNGDNGAWASTYSGYIGSIEFTAATPFSDNGGAVLGNSVIADLPVILPAGAKVLYGLIEARAGYVSANGERFTVTLDVQIGE